MGISTEPVQAKETPFLPPHHPVFDRFERYVGPRPEGMFVDFSGAHFKASWDRNPYIPPIGEQTWAYPVFDEEYFEWIDILETIELSDERYTFVELGAGYGRWAVRAGLLAKSKGITNVHLCGVEAEPQHQIWLADAFALNGFDDQSSVIPHAISYSGEPVPFVIGAEDGRAGNWFGQTIGWEELRATDDTYHGYPVHRSPLGYEQIFVDVVPLEAILAPFECVDLIDMDLQGHEREVARHSMEVLSSKVKRVHIGTHGADIEAELRTAFSIAGWKSLWDFPCGQRNETPFGTIEFVDGVQSWLNPRFS